MTQILNQGLERFSLICEKGKTPIMNAYDTNIESRIRAFCFK
jgi:hypothetical protein